MATQPTVPKGLGSITLMHKINDPNNSGEFILKLEEEGQPQKKYEGNFTSDKDINFEDINQSEWLNNGNILRLTSDFTTLQLNQTNVNIKFVIDNNGGAGPEPNVNVNVTMEKNGDTLTLTMNDVVKPQENTGGGSRRSKSSSYKRSSKKNRKNRKLSRRNRDTRIKQKKTKQTK